MSTVPAILYHRVAVIDSSHLQIQLGLSLLLDASIREYSQESCHDQCHHRGEGQIGVQIPRSLLPALTDEEAGATEAEGYVLESAQVDVYDGPFVSCGLLEL